MQAPACVHQALKQTTWMLLVLGRFKRVSLPQLRLCSKGFLCALLTL
jgi:hypothetical protein